MPFSANNIFISCIPMHNSLSSDFTSPSCFSSENILDLIFVTSFVILIHVPSIPTKQDAATANNSIIFCFRVHPIVQVFCLSHQKNVPDLVSSVFHPQYKNPALLLVCYNLAY